MCERDAEGSSIFWWFFYKNDKTVFGETSWFNNFVLTHLRLLISLSIKGKLLNIGWGKKWTSIYMLWSMYISDGIEKNQNFLI